MFDEIADFALDLAKECGQILSEAFHKVGSKFYSLYVARFLWIRFFELEKRDHNVVTKVSEVDLVTATDKLIEKTILEKVGQKYPDHKFIGEEGTSDGKAVVLTDDIT